jgi:flagellar hook-associated protein 2
MGLDQISTMPQNAVFDINGEEHTASSNKFMVMDHYRVTLNDESDETVQIEMKPDFDAMLDNVSDLVNVYNSMVDMASSHITDAEDSDRLLKEIQRVTKVHKEDLDSSGFMVQDDGHIDIDESLILQSANEGKVEDSLETLNSLKKDLVRKADDMSINPMNYVNKKLIAYPNPVRNFTSPYVSSIYSGMMFNGYI